MGPEVFRYDVLHDVFRPFVAEIAHGTQGSQLAEQTFHADHGTRFVVGVFFENAFDFGLVVGVVFEG